MMKNKKAQIFTIMAILLIMLMFISFEIFSIVDQRHQVQTRVSTMENFLLSIEKNLERQLFIAGFRIIFISQNEMLETGNYVSDVDALFNEAFFNGTVNGEAEDILVGVTYDELITAINQKATKINVNVVFTDPSIEITQDDPWHVKFSLIANFTMDDNSNLVRWDKIQVITAYIPIEGFLDPVYIKNTNGQVTPKINRTLYTTFDTASLLDHTQKNYYINSTEAPSFLDKMEGNFNNNVNGIESLVNIPDLSAQGIQTFDKSIADHIYFSTSNPSASVVSGMPSWFKLDSSHLEIYGV